MIDGRRQNLGSSVLELLARAGITVEQIVSKGHASPPPGFWYDQHWDEWVIVLAGEARLRFEEEKDARTLAAGHYVLIPAKTRHRLDEAGSSDGMACGAPWPRGARRLKAGTHTKWCPGAESDDPEKTKA
jgi:mannose-6-phosphate isomerase-like protein (cupin superfamily)